MTVIRNDGTVVPLTPYKESGIIDHYWMPYLEFAELEEVFCQRNTEGRLKKAQKHLAELLPEHVVVFVCRLTKDCTINGKRYNKGTKFRVDSNTRALNWRTGGSDAIPQELLVIEFAFDNADRIRLSYNTFDSPDSLERNQEKLYGILSGMYHYTPQSEKLIKGQILSGLNKACHFFYPEMWNQFTIRISELPGQVGAFIEEIKTLDLLITTPSHWDQALICTALMALKKYGCDNEKVLEALRIIDERELTGKKGKEWDGITHIVWEWTIDQKSKDCLFKDKTTNWNKIAGLNRTVAFCCYWFDKYMIGKTGAKLGNNWQEVPKKWKDEQVTTLNSLFNMKTPVTV
jgi:hypothetical protein|tara:strand:+ start:112 stop:1149 length:1038 start_codon:yes stop_codon:yes gene_type:complete